MRLDEIIDNIVLKVTAEAKRLGGAVPYIPDESGHYTDTGLYWWTNGFWAGLLWQVYSVTGNELLKKTAIMSEERLDAALDGFEGIDHDVGFLWLPTAGAGFTVTGSERSKRRLLHAATLLAGRYNPFLKIIRAWDSPWMQPYDTAGGAIIDTMMNLPLLYRAGELTGDPRFRVIADCHAETMMRYMLRPDGSVNHQLVFDVDTGEVIARPGGQGYGEGSSWSRGQAWALYGFSLAYHHTKNEEYLAAAKRTAAYFTANAALTDWVPLCDFRAPAEPVWYDTTAGAAAACGLLETAGHVPENERTMYLSAAEKMIGAITERWCDFDPAADGIVGGGSVSYHAKVHHERIIYGDYFYTEAVLRMAGKGIMIW